MLYKIVAKLLARSSVCDLETRSAQIAMNWLYEQISLVRAVLSDKIREVTTTCTVHEI